MSWEIIYRIGIIMGIIAFFPIVGAAVSYILYNRRLRRNINAVISRAQTHQPIYIELTGKNIITIEAENYIHKQNLPGAVLPLIELRHNGININDFNEIEKVKEDILKIKLEAMSHSPECIHLFYSGPVVVGIIVGDVFSNCKNVYLYHKDNTGYIFVSRI